MSLDAAISDIVRAIVEELRPVVLEDLRRVLREEHERRVPSFGSGTATEAVFVSTSRAAEVAGVQPAAVRNWIARGELPSHRAGRLIRVRLDELKAFLACPSEKRVGGEIVDLDIRARSILRRRGSGS